MTDDLGARPFVGLEDDGAAVRVVVPLALFAGWCSELLGALLVAVGPRRPRPGDLVVLAAQQHGQLCVREQCRPPSGWIKQALRHGSGVGRIGVAPWIRPSWSGASCEASAAPVASAEVVLEFGILGPLEVRSATGPIPLGGAKTRALLAALLLERNRPVDPERLALALWGEDAAHSSGGALRVQISRLRALLGDTGVLVATAAGYELRVAPGAVDEDRFETLVAKGRAASRPDEAGAYLRAALELWRGPALADVAAESFAQSAIARLEEQRLDALEARLDADLAAGRHDILVPELQQLTRTYPLRERLHRQLMLALYRSERQADALAAYRAVRTRLAEELGLEPGPALRDLERAILAQDPALIEHPHAGPGAHELLVGRDRELAEILSFVDAGGGPRLVLVTGEAGIGKSALARAVAQQLPPSRVLYGRCDEEPLAPFQPFSEALRDL